MIDATAPRAAAPSFLPRAALGLLSDERLAARAGLGDQEAFAVLFRRHHQAVYRYCLSIVRNPEDAADVLQTTMLKALQRLASGGKELALRPWLFRVAHNEAISLLRRGGHPVELGDEIASAGAVEDASETRARLAGVLDDLADLPERQRGALVMRELAGFSYERIAAAFGTSPAAAKQTVYEARIALAEMERGRELSCQAVTERISERDGRMLRGRAMQAHLRGCRDCRGFRASIAARRTGLALLPGLSPEQASAMLKALFGAGGGPGAGTAVAVLASGAKLGAASLATKAAVSAAVTVVLAVGAGGGALVVTEWGDERPATSVKAIAPAAVSPRGDEPSARPIAAPAERAEPATEETGTPGAVPGSGIDIGGHAAGAGGAPAADAPSPTASGPVSQPSGAPSTTPSAGSGSGTWSGTASQPSQPLDPSRIDGAAPSGESPAPPPTAGEQAPAPTVPSETVPSARPAASGGSPGDAAAPSASEPSVTNGG